MGDTFREVFVAVFGHWVGVCFRTSSFEEKRLSLGKASAGRGASAAKKPAGGF
jgi:hypothetical protein